MALFAVAGLSTFSPTAGGLLTGVMEPSHAQEINRQGEAEVFGIAQAIAPIAAELVFIGTLLSVSIESM